jgi:UDP-N-acetyl-D-mannosaminuronate dehydrogenase
LPKISNRESGAARDTSMDLSNRTIAIIGLGYVGLPLAV